MEISRALNQLAEIQEKLARAQVYRGYRPFSIALTALGAAGGGWLSTQSGSTLVWPLVAVLCVLLVGGEMAYDYCVSHGQHQRRLARRLLAQFLPGLGLGAAWTAVWVHSGLPQGCLPGVWAMTFAFCLLSSRPYLPKGVGWVGMFYGISGLAMTTPLGMAYHNLSMALTFGIGQSALAATLHWNHPREGA